MYIVGRYKREMLFDNKLLWFYVVQQFLNYNKTMLVNIIIWWRHEYIICVTHIHILKYMTHLVMKIII